MGSISLIAAGTELRGRLTVVDDLQFEGRLTGELSVGGDLTVAAGGGIAGPLEARSVVVRGTVRGTVHGVERVEICGGGSVAGDVTAACVVLAEGSELDGRIELTV